MPASTSSVPMPVRRCAGAATSLGRSASSPVTLQVITPTVRGGPGDQHPTVVHHRAQPAALAPLLGFGKARALQGHDRVQIHPPGRAGC